MNITAEEVVALGFQKSAGRDVAEGFDVPEDQSAYSITAEDGLVFITVLFVDGSTRHPFVYMGDERYVLEMNGVRSANDLRELYRLVNGKELGKAGAT